MATATGTNGGERPGTGERPGEQRLADAGRPEEKDAARGLGSDRAETFGLAQEVDEFGDFALGVFLAGHVLEADLLLRRRLPGALRLRMPETVALEQLWYHLHACLSGQGTNL